MADAGKVGDEAKEPLLSSATGAQSPSDAKDPASTEESDQKDNKANSNDGKDKVKNDNNGKGDSIQAEDDKKAEDAAPDEQEKEKPDDSPHEEPGLATTALPVDSDDDDEDESKNDGGEAKYGAAYNDYSVDTSADATSYLQVRNYKKFLRESEGDKAALCNALHDNVRRGHVKKLVLTCHTLKTLGVSLGDEEMLGAVSKETSLCLAVILGKTDCAKVLIEHGGEELIVVAYKTKQHLGITALHLAILNQNQDVVDCLLNALDGDTKQQLLHKRARGKHFESRFHCACIPLTIAAGVGDIAIFNTLVRHGADLWVGDEETGNTVLHSLAAIAVRKPALAEATLKAILESDDVKNWWVEKKKTLDADKVKGLNRKAALLKAENRDGMTPFIYASCLGATGFAEAIITTKNVYKYPQFDVGPSSFSLYDVSELDPVSQSDKPSDPPNPVEIHKARKMKALEIFCYVLGDDNLSYGELPVVKLSMVNKWEAYKKWFVAWMVFHLCVMLLFTFTTNYEPHASPPQPIDSSTATANSNSTASPEDIKSLLTVKRNGLVIFSDCLVLLAAIVYFIIELYDIFLIFSMRYWRAKSFRRTRMKNIPFYMTLHYDMFRFILLFFSTSVIVDFGLKLAQHKARDFFCAAAAITGWTFMLFFARAFRDIGIFTVMLQRMVARELLYFSVVFIIIMTAFSTATYCLFKGIVDDVPEQVDTLSITFFSHFKLLVGLEELAITEEARLPFVMKVLVISFIVLANIMLMNMLIAAMNNTYTMLDSLKEIMWMKMRTKAVLLIERRLLRRWRPTQNLQRHGRENQWFLTLEEVTTWNPTADQSDLTMGSA